VSTIEHDPSCTPNQMTPPDEEGIRDCLGCGLWEQIPHGPGPDTDPED
jgi:hypothetical protein